MPVLAWLASHCNANMAKSMTKAVRRITTCICILLLFCIRLAVGGPQVFASGNCAARVYHLATIPERERRLERVPHPSKPRSGESQNRQRAQAPQKCFGAGK